MFVSVIGSQTTTATVSQAWVALLFIATCLKSGHEVMCWVHSFQLLNNECVAESDNMAQTWTACLRIRQCTVNQTESLIVDWWQTVSNWKAECLKLKSCVYGRVTRLCGNTNGLQCFVMMLGKHVLVLVIKFEVMYVLHMQLVMHSLLHQESN